MTNSTAACSNRPAPSAHRQDANNPGRLEIWVRSLWSAQPRTRLIEPTYAGRLTTLKAMRVGERGRVQGFAEGGRAYRRKLLSMGLTPGVQFQVLRVAPLGDPVEVRVRGSNLSLRKDEAATLRVEPLS